MADSIVDTYRQLHPGSAELHEESARVFPNGVTHDTRFLTPFPIFVDHAKGSRKWDVDENEYIDYVMGHGALFMGHTHPEITKAIIEQAEKGTHYGANHRLELEWGQLVKDIVPCAEEVRFTSSGTEATLMAIRLARAYTGRDRVLRFDKHFHGWHDAVVGARMAESDNPVSAGVPVATMSNSICVPQGDTAAVEDRLAAGDVAAVIIEPTGALMGALPLDDTFLAFLREATRKHNTVLIFDEVVTGFRAAPGGAQGRYGITPDLTSLAKILAGGMPGGAVCGKADIVSMIEFRDGRWNSEQRVSHPGTFNANPVSSAAGSAMLRLVQTGEHHVHADALAERLVPALNEVLAKAGAPGAVYGWASRFHITLGKEVERPEGMRWTAETPPPATDIALVVGMKRAMLNHGVDLMGGNGGFTSGVHTDADIEATIEAFAATVQDLQADGLL